MELQLEQRGSQGQASCIRTARVHRLGHPGVRLHCGSTAERAIPDPVSSPRNRLEGRPRLESENVTPTECSLQRCPQFPPKGLPSHARVPADLGVRRC